MANQTYSLGGRCLQCRSSYTSLAIGYLCEARLPHGQCGGDIVGEGIPSPRAAEQYGAGLSQTQQQAQVQMYHHQQQQQYTSRLLSDIAGLKEKLAASEKERERLKGELKEAIHGDAIEPRGPTCCAEATEKLCRELENLKRSTNCELGDLRGGLEELERISADKQVRIAWLERELERERAKNRKRGL